MYATGNLVDIVCCDTRVALVGRNVFSWSRRWWNQTVRSLKLCIPLTLLPSVTCQEAIELMSAESIDQVPVVDASG